ncbi:Juvenile hormone-inducible protein [Nesidiocoris tenuis]|uniref:Juvenile hormone-inducible protein n=1 Tax=Nesidiocoris tenuis TaxID=355587 RepID=A0ABN7BBE3_9HEMI|nr:Juvenile hormone-inducible protein [Nesidiocoris tenuis]
MDELRSRIVAMTKAGVFGPPGTWPYVRDNNGDQAVGLQFASEIEFFRIGLDRSGGFDAPRPPGANPPCASRPPGATNPCASHPPQPPGASECDYEEIFIAVKTQLKGSKERQFTNMDAMFFNEVFMYKTLIHTIEAEDFFPKCFYAEACAGNNPARDIVITEDVKQRGFRTVHGDTLDLAHLKLALGRLGRFHGLSYRAKRRQGFANVAELRPIKFDDEFGALLSATTSRGIEPLVCDEKYAGPLAALRSELREGRSVLRSLKTPQEPYAVLCHGEFHKSNMMFSYDGNGDVDDVVFLDLQMSLYSDPSTDISFLLHMNAPQTTRDEHWDDLLAEYWTGVTSVVDDPGFGFDEFSSNFRKKCVYGFLPTSIFLPLTMDDVEADESIEDFLSHPVQERIAMMGQMGGARATEALAAILKDLVRRGCVDAFLGHYNSTKQRQIEENS